MRRRLMRRAHPTVATPGSAYNVLPPGQYGNFPPFPNTPADQLKLYDALTPLFDQVTDADLPNYFKPNVFGLQRAPEANGGGGRPCRTS